MQAFRVKKVVTPDGRVELNALPFRPGEVVEIIVLALDEQEQTPSRSLKGSVVKYIDPTEPVALDDWDVIK